jgi:hypothetical protein
MRTLCLCEEGGWVRVWYWTQRKVGRPFVCQLVYILFHHAARASDNSSGGH